MQRNDRTFRISSLAIALTLVGLAVAAAAPGANAFSRVGGPDECSDALVSTNCASDCHDEYDGNTGTWHRVCNTTCTAAAAGVCLADVNSLAE